MFQFNKETASKAGGSSYIDVTGYYKGKFTEAKLHEINNSKVQFINFTFESDSGEMCYLSMCVTDKGGKPVDFTNNMISALMGIWKITDDGYAAFDNRFTNFENKKIMLALQREERPDSKYGYQMNILHFFEPVTEKTYSELYENKPAETSKKVLSDKKAKKQTREPGSDDIEKDSEQDKLPWE
jgi:maltooligosyltrehalose synthase